MKSGQVIFNIISARTGFKPEHVEEVANKLIQSGVMLDDTKRLLTFLLLALYSKANPSSATSVAKHYWQLRADDEAYLGRMLENIIAIFLEQQRADFSDIAYRSAFQIYDSRTPAATLRIPCVNRMAEIIYRDEQAWAYYTNRHSAFLTGETLYDLCADLRIATAVAA